jgi:hypothetical protein
MDSSTAATRALEIVEGCKPFLVGHGPDVQGAALAELLALWLAGHAPGLRDDVLAHHLRMVQELTKINARIIRGE